MSTATLTLGVVTAGAVDQLQALTNAAVNAKGALAALSAGGDTGNSGILRHVARVKQDLHTLVAETKNVHQALKDMMEPGGSGGFKTGGYSKAGNDAGAAFRRGLTAAVGKEWDVPADWSKSVGGKLFAGLTKQETVTEALATLKAASAERLAIAKEEDSAWAQYEKAKATQVKLYQDQQVKLYQMASAERLAIAKEEDSAWAQYEKAKATQVKLSQDQQVKLYQIASAERLAIAKEEAAAQSRYVGKLGTLGGYSTAIRSAPMLDHGAESSASTALLAQKTRELGDAAEGASGKVKKHSGEVRVLHDTARGAAAGVGYLWMTWGNIGAMAAGFAGVRGASAALKDMAEIEVNLVKASNESGVAMSKLNEQMMKMYKDGMMPMTTGPAEVSLALKELVYAGFSAENAFKTLPSVLKFAEVGEISLADAAKVLQQTLNSFKGTTAVQAADVLAKAAAASATDITEMTHAMNQAVSIGALYNSSIEDTSVALAILAKSGIKGGEAGTALRQFMAEMASPTTQKAQDAIKKLGLELYTVKDGVKKLKDMPGIISELREKLKGYSETDQEFYLSAISRISNQRGVKFLSQAIQIAQKDLDDLNNDVKNKSLGFVDNLYQKLSETTRGTWKQVTAGLEATAQGSVKELDQAMKDLGQTMLDLVKSSEFKTFLDGLVITFKTLVGVINEHGEKIAWMVGTYAMVKTATGAVDLLGGAWKGLRGLLSDTHQTFTNFNGAVENHAKALGTDKVGLGGKIVMVGGLFARWIPVVGVAYGLIQGLLAMMGGTTETTTERISRRIKELKQLTKDMDPTAELKDAEKLLGAMEETERMRRGGTGPTKAMKDQMDAQRAYIKLLKETLDARGLLDKSLNQPAVPTKKNDKVGFTGQRLNLASFDSGTVTDFQRFQVTLQEAIGAVTEETVNLAAAQGDVLDVAEELNRSDRLSVKLKAELANGTKEYTKAEQAKANQGIRNLEELEKTKVAQEAVTQAEKLRAAGAKSAMEAEAKASADRAKHEQNLLDLKVQSGEVTQASATAMAELTVVRERDHAIGSAQADLFELNSRLNSAEIAGEIVLAQKLRNEIGLRSQNIEAMQRESTQASELNAAKERAAVFSGYKEKFGDTAAQVRNAEEMVRAITTQNKAVKDLTTSERDKNIVAMEGDIARATAFISQLERDNHNTENAVKEKERLVEQLGLYSAQIEEKKRLDQDWVLGAKRGLKEYAEVTTSAATTAADAMKGAMKGMEDALVQFATTGKISFSNLTNSIISDMIRMQIQQNVTKPLANMGMNLIASFFGAPSGGASVVPSAPTLTYAAQGGVFPGSSLASYRNSIVTKPTTFAFAQGVMGEKVGSPGEAIMPLSRMPGGDLGVKTSGGGNVTVNVINNSSGVQATQQTRSDGKGNQVIDVFIEQIKGAIAGDIARGNGAIPAALGRTYGLNPTPGMY